MLISRSLPCCCLLRLCLTYFISIYFIQLFICTSICRMEINVMSNYNSIFGLIIWFLEDLRPYLYWTTSLLRFTRLSCCGCFALLFLRVWVCARTLCDNYVNLQISSTFCNESSARYHTGS